MWQHGVHGTTKYEDGLKKQIIAFIGYRKIRKMVAEVPKLAQNAASIYPKQEPSLRQHSGT